MSKLIELQFKEAKRSSVRFASHRPQVAVRVLPPGPGELPLKGSTKVRQSPLPVRLSEQEKEIVRRKAKDAGCTVNAFVKEAILKSHYRLPRNPELTRAILALNRELTAQGNNLNQIAYQLNAGTISIERGETSLDRLSRSMLRTHMAVRRLWLKEARRLAHDHQKSYQRWLQGYGEVSHRRGQE